MSAYDALAQVYDRLMDDIDYDAWAQYYMTLINRAGVTPRTLCDCACGTGALSVRFAARNVRVTGVDLSGPMLELAQQKARVWGVRPMFISQDMCRLELPRPVDALICACDGVNYLLDDDRLNAFFSKVHSALRPGGAFAFDISSAWKLEETIGNGLFGEDRDDVTYLWFNHADKNKRTVAMNLTFFVRKENGLYERFDEDHVQKAHDPRHLIGLMQNNGFAEIELFGDKTLLPPEPAEKRIHFLAVRQ